MARPEKEAVVADLRERLERAAAVLLTEYRGLKAGEMTRLRRQLREAGLEYRVVKNTLLRRAAQGTRAETLCAALEGPIAVAFSYVESMEAAKVLAQVAREFEPLKLRAGIIETMVCDAAQLDAVAQLPDRQELQARAVGTIAGPLSGFLTLTQGVLRNLAGILQAKVEKTQGEPASA